MAFVRVDPCVSVQRRSAPTLFDRSPSSFNIAALPRSVFAVLASTLVHGALLYLIFTHLPPANDDPAKGATSGTGLTLIDLSVPQPREEPAASTEEPAEAVAKAEPPIMVAPPPVVEWKIVHMRSPTSAIAAVSNAASAAAAGKGAGAGPAGGNGDDPYAGAAFRPRGEITSSTSPSRSFTLMAPFLAAEVNRQSLEVALVGQLQKLAGSGFSLFLKVDAKGRAIDVRVLAATQGIDARAARAIRTALLGRMLLVPDPSGGVREMVIGPISVQPG